MKNILTKTFFAVALLVSANTAQAQTDVTAQVNQALLQKNLKEVRMILNDGSVSVDPVIKALLKHTQKVIKKEAAFSGQMMQLAGQYAPKISKPSVPVICSDLRRIVDAVPEDQAASPLSATIVKVSEEFSRAPVVISAGSPNQCETAFLRISTLRGNAPLLAQVKSASTQRLPATTIRPVKAGTEAISLSPMQQDPAALTVIETEGAGASDMTARASEALAQKNLTEVHGMLVGATGPVDPVIKALLTHTKKVLAQDTAFSDKMMKMAGQYASKISAPSVPAVCADLRQIVDAVSDGGQATASLSGTMADVSGQFSRAPAVVSAGRPNQCESALLRIAALRGEDPLLIQLPGMSGPGLPPTTIRPRIPPTNPSPEDKPSAD